MMPVSIFPQSKKCVRLPRGAAYYLSKHPDIVSILSNADMNSITVNQIVNEIDCTVYDAISITRKLVTYGIIERIGFSDDRKHVYKYRLSLQGKQWIDSNISNPAYQQTDAAESAGGVL